MRDIDRFRGCLIGGAAGDALGYAVEFLSEGTIHSQYGEKGITEYSLTDGIAKISDDTQMAMFTANGLLLGTTRGMMRGIMADYSDYIYVMYKCWLKTQEDTYPVKSEYRFSWLLNIPELFSRRAPGNACLSALESGNMGTIDEPINNSKGCGGVMRVAPIGLYFCDRGMSYADSDRIGADAAAITHGHELGYITAACMVHIVRKVAEEKVPDLKGAVEDAIEAVREQFGGAKHVEELIDLLNLAVELAYSDVKDVDAIHELGEGWVAEEALAIAVFSVLRYESDFDRAIRCAVNHKGDSDSTGAIAGNILGACIGYEKIPQKYKEHLELRDVILELADDLCKDCQMTEYGLERDPVWVEKYIEASYSIKA